MRIDNITESSRDALRNMLQATINSKAPSETDSIVLKDLADKKKIKLKEYNYLVNMYQSKKIKTENFLNANFVIQNDISSLEIEELLIKKNIILSADYNSRLLCINGILSMEGESMTFNGKLFTKRELYLLLIRRIKNEAINRLSIEMDLLIKYNEFNTKNIHLPNNDEHYLTREQIIKNKDKIATIKYEIEKVSNNFGYDEHVLDDVTLMDLIDEDIYKLYDKIYQYDLNVEHDVNIENEEELYGKAI